MPRLTDPAMRMYLIVRSMIAESKKNLPGQGLRRMTIDQMCFLLSRDTGKPVSVSLMYQILALLEELDLMVPVDTKQDVGASQLKGKEKAVRGILRGFMVRDLPPVPYTGWRNVWDKLNHYRPDWRENPPLPPVHVTTAVVDANGRHLSRVTQVPQDVAFQDSGTEPEDSDQGADQDQDSFQDSGTAFQDSGTAFQEAGTDSGSTSENAAPKQGSPTTLSKKGDAASPRSGGDGRRPSDGSSACAREGGSAASSKDHPTPDNEEPQARAKTSSKAKHTGEQLDTAREVCAFFPAELRIRLVPVMTQAILDALDGDVPGSGRTVEQLGARIQQRWNHHGYASAFYAGELSKPIGAAVEMVRPLKATDRYGCGNPRCEVGKDVDTGVDCHVCPERLAARRAARRDGNDQFPSPRPGSSGPVWWECESPMCRKPTNGERSASGLCPNCDAQLERAAALLMTGSPTAEPTLTEAPEGLADGQEDAEVDEETIRLRAAHARRYGTPEQVEAYCTNAPF
jgi:hypothetical protein